MNGNCDICKTPLTKWVKDPDMMFDSVYCDTCMENEKTAIELRQAFYRNLERSMKAKESAMLRYTNDDDDDFIKHHRFINRR